MALISTTLISLIFILKCFTKPYVIELLVTAAKKIRLFLSWSGTNDLKHKTPLIRVHLAANVFRTLVCHQYSRFIPNFGSVQSGGVIVAQKRGISSNDILNTIELP